MELCLRTRGERDKIVPFEDVRGSFTYCADFTHTFLWHHFQCNGHAVFLSDACIDLAEAARCKFVSN